MYLILESIEYAPDRIDHGFSVGAELYISVEDIYFPSEHWYDLAYIDLKEWFPRLISFGNNHTDRCALSFMDGPYSVILNRHQDNRVEASFLCKGAVIYSIEELCFTDFLKSIKGCCHKYDRFLHMHGKENHFTSEINQLKTIIDR